MEVQLPGELRIYSPVRPRRPAGAVKASAVLWSNGRVPQAGARGGGLSSPLDADDALKALQKVDPAADPVEQDPGPPSGDPLKE
jgi:hypothetical protein